MTRGDVTWCDVWQCRICSRLSDVFYKLIFVLSAMHWKYTFLTVEKSVTSIKKNYDCGIYGLTERRPDLWCDLVACRRPQRWAKKSKKSRVSEFGVCLDQIYHLSAAKDLAETLWPFSMLGLALSKVSILWPYLSLTLGITPVYVWPYLTLNRSLSFDLMRLWS